MADFLFAVFLGSLVSLFFGWIFVPAFHRWTKRLSDEEAGREPNPKLIAGKNSVITGTLERTIFTVLFVWRPEAAMAAMAGWIVTKAAAHWGREAPIEDKMEWISHGFLSMQTTVVSLLFAVAGGLAARWALHLPMPAIDGWPK
jgi:hypothetical protein